MAVIPDEIRDIANNSESEQIKIMFDYIKYMHEQLEFWASNLGKKINSINNDLFVLGERLSEHKETKGD